MTEVGKDLSLGRQMTIEFYDCDPEILADADRMESVFLAAAKASGATVIGSHFHRFEPQGVSGVLIISESHFTVHAWPEYDYAAVDIFTCSESVSFQAAAESLRSGMGSKRMIVSSVMNRGIVGNNGVERLIPVCDDENARFTLSWQKRFESTDAWGMLLSIDVYDTPTMQENAILAFADAFAEECGVKHCVVETDCCRHEEEEVLTLLCRAGAAFLSGRFVPCRRAAYLDLFHPAFFEPRPVAERALHLLRGSHYRMQSTIRQ